MTDERLIAPPPATYICGGSWKEMPDASRREVWDFYDYLADGGKAKHGSYDNWRLLRRQAHKGTQ